MTVSIFQLNAKKALIAAVEFNASLKKIGAYIGLITEPHVHKGKLSTVPPQCQKISQGEDVRAAILASKDLNIIKVGHLSNRAVSYTHLTLPTIYSV